MRAALGRRDDGARPKPCAWHPNIILPVTKLASPTNPFHHPTTPPHDIRRPLSYSTPLVLEAPPVYITARNNNPINNRLRRILSNCRLTHVTETRNTNVDIHRF